MHQIGYHLLHQCFYTIWLTSFRPLTILEVGGHSSATSARGINETGKEKIIYNYMMINMKSEAEIIGNIVLVAMHIKPFQLSAAVCLNLKGAAEIL